MTTMDNEATTIHNDCEDATQIVEGNSLEVEEEKTETEVEDQKIDDKKHNHKTAKTIGGIAVGGAMLGSAASVLMDTDVESTEGIAEDTAHQDNISIAAEAVELPELIVEALASKHETSVNTSFSEDVNEEETPANSETIYAESVDLKPGKTDTSSSVHTQSDPTGSVQSVTQSEEDSYGEDIPIVSVGNVSDNDSDVQILGVTQDISTGYNVGHLLVDGEEVVVIDVDGDMVFDSMVVDLNHDGDTTADEIIDIRQHSLSLDDLASNSNLFSDPSSSTGDVPDYLSETI